MKTQHTPGPWRVHYYGEIVGAQEKPGACVPVVCAPNESNPCRDANARLIASAPELLSSLERVAFLASHYLQDGKDGAIFQHEVESAIALIAKARGEA